MNYYTKKQPKYSHLSFPFSLKSNVSDTNVLKKFISDLKKLERVDAINIFNLLKKDSKSIIKKQLIIFLYKSKDKWVVNYEMTPLYDIPSSYIINESFMSISNLYNKKYDIKDL